MFTTLKICLIGAICFIQASHGYWSRPHTQSPRAWNDFRVKFSKTGSDGYFGMPRSLDDPLIKNYVHVPVTSKYNLKLYCYPNDPRVCVMFDKSGAVAGIQISFLKSELTQGTHQPFLYDFSKQPIFHETNIFNKPAWSFKVYFANPDHFAAGGARTKTSETADGIFVHLENGFFEVDRMEPAQAGVGKMRDFVEQSCIPGMGNHYFYKMTDKTKCEKMQAFFPMYENGSLVSFGILVFGKQGHLHRKWFEDTSSIGNPLRNFPQCLPQWAEKYGMTSLHVYLVNNPKNIDCGSYSH